MEKIIKKHEYYKCLEDWVMEDGTVEFKKGRIYVSRHDGCLTNVSGDDFHEMPLDEDFYNHFVKLEPPKPPVKPIAKPELTEREMEMLSLLSSVVSIFGRAYPDKDTVGGKKIEQIEMFINGLK